MRTASPPKRRSTGLAPSGSRRARPQTPRPASSAPSAATLRRTARRAGFACPSSCRLLRELRRDLVAPGLRRHREAEARAAVEITLRDGAREVADAADVG